MQILHIYIYNIYIDYIYNIYILFRKKNGTSRFVKYFDIDYINYIFIQRNTYKIHYINYFLKLQF